ncbi:MAG: hypothetical protein WEE89_11065 [Gemmatimonadota bacterium]
MTVGLLLVLCAGLMQISPPPGACCAPPPAARCPPPNQLVARGTFTRDWPHDVGHVVSLSVFTPAVYGFSLELGASRRPARLIAAGTALAAMVLKEWHDHRAVGNFSGRDIAFGIVGTGVGFYIAERINWNLPGRTEKNQR